MCLTCVILKSGKARSFEVRKIREFDHCRVSLVFFCGVILLESLLQQNDFHYTRVCARVYTILLSVEYFIQRLTGVKISLHKSVLIIVSNSAF